MFAETLTKGAVGAPGCEVPRAAEGITTIQVWRVVSVIVPVFAAAVQLVAAVPVLIENEEAVPEVKLTRRTRVSA